MEILGFGNRGEGNRRDGPSRRTEGDVQVGHLACHLVKYETVDVYLVLGFLRLGLGADLVCL